jgi:hypothetical protein
MVGMMKVLIQGSGGLTHVEVPYPTLEEVSLDSYDSGNGTLVIQIGDKNSNHLRIIATPRELLALAMKMVSETSEALEYE